jgi:outer membrane protein OmpA-like peptidoglycan-associated protein
MDSRNGMKRAGLALCLGLAAGLSACSSVPDWVDPTTWFGSDNKTASDSDLSQAGEEAQNQQAAGQTPDLADVPAKPVQSDDSQNNAVEGQLAADRSRANYSADALRGGTEAAAPPPPASAPTDQQVAEVATTPSASASSDDSAAPASSDSSSTAASQAADESAPAAPTAPAQPEAAPPPAASDQQATSSMPGTLPDESAAPAPAPQQPAAAPAPAPAPAPVQVASNEPPPAAAAPAPAEAAASEPAPAPQRPRTDALGFAPSSAPPLDSSVGQFVPSQVVNRYQQTQMASIAPVYGYSTMSAGTVGMRAAVVTFAGDRTVLDDKARGLIKAAADAFMARGAGYIRVVGHASSRSMDVSAERHMELDFDHSQARATAVAQALIKAGVPADKVLVEAVGDSAPVQAVGADADRSAEIFLQG